MRTYDEDRTTLPPLTKSIIDTYGRKTDSQFADRPRDPTGTPNAVSAIIDAIHQLETRVIALETP
ncbi:MAG: hypothetical protein U5N53_18475 [Mycobacterium sp.]|nr:hypothetical protein [Mycobacterium sp.]